MAKIASEQGSKWTCPGNYMWLDLTEPGFDAQSYVKRYGDFKY